MSYLFVIGGVVSFVISLLIAWNFFKHYSKDEIKKIVRWFSFTFFAYLFLTIFSFAWRFGSLEFNASDFLLLYALALVCQTIVLCGTFSMMYGQKRVFSWLLFYVAAFFVAYLSWSYLLHALLVLSFLLHLVLFLHMYTHSVLLKRVSYIGISFGGAGVVAVLLTFFGLVDFYISSIILNVLFLVFTFLFFKKIVDYPAMTMAKTLFEKEHGLSLFLRYFLYMMVLISLVLISTISFHELGHVAVANYFGCESRTILYESWNYPHSEIICSDVHPKEIIALAGPLFPLIAGLILLWFGGRHLRAISLLVIGFDFISAYRDLQELGLSGNITLASSLVGMMVLFFGVVFLAQVRTEDERDLES